MDTAAVVEVNKADIDQKRDETSRILEGLGLPEQAPSQGTILHLLSLVLHHN